MSNQDWWPNQSTSFSTPSRPYANSSNGGFNPLSSQSHTPQFASQSSYSFGQSQSTSQSQSSHSQMNSSRARFAGDELDDEDLQRADNVKFYPTFASSPAGKLSGSVGTANIGSPGGLGKTASPPARRSPQARFSVGGGQSPNDA